MWKYANIYWDNLVPVLWFTKINTTYIIGHIHLNTVFRITFRRRAIFAPEMGGIKI